MPRILFSHVTGNPNSKHAALCLAENGWLAQCHTTLAWNPDHAISAALPSRWQAMLSKRDFPAVVRPYLRTHPAWELIRLALRDRATKLSVMKRLQSIDNVAKRFDLSVARALHRSADIHAVYGYMDSSLETFTVARSKGVKTIYELPTPYWKMTRDIVADESERVPEWATTLPDLDSQKEKMQRRDAELSLADLVIVPSTFVRESLRKAPQFKASVRVVPYGCPESQPRTETPATPFQPLRVLFVGSLSAAKGLPCLDAAMNELGTEATLTLIGRRADPRPNAALEALLSRHRHIDGTSNDQVLDEMSRHDVLVLPTLFEGQALVILEALARGLPVITTPSSGAADLIEEFQAGFVVPVRDPAAFTGRLRHLHSNRSELRRMSAAALHAGAVHSWSRYRQNLGNALSGVLAENHLVS